eukprot:m.248688 g.248688  ORF g.248688 m.248688 type:complete len:225 (-) comp26672_c2_seq7:1333-2007(-)
MCQPGLLVLMMTSLGRNCLLLPSRWNGKAAGANGLPNKVWKAMSQSPESPAASVLLQVVNEIWTTAEIPECVRTSRTISIPKTGDISNTNNYRGISLIDTILSLISRIVSRRLTVALDEAGVIITEQAGFRPGGETHMQTITLCVCVGRRKIQGQDTILGFLDFKKAFDMVPTKLLLAKMQGLGVGGRTLKYIEGAYPHDKIIEVGLPVSHHVRKLLEKSLQRH